MFVDRVNHDDDDQSNDMNKQKYSKDDITELQTRFNTPNFGLKSSRDRPPLRQKSQQPLSHWQNMCKEFQERVQLKFNKTNEKNSI